MSKRAKTPGGTQSRPVQIGLKYGIYLLFLFVILLLAITCPSFRTMANASNVFLQVTTYAVLGIGMTFVIMTGGIDVSIGGIMVCCGSVYSILAQSGVSEPLAIGAMFVIALLVGTVNGVSVAYLGMPAFLATLATQCMCRGMSLVLTGGVSFRKLGASFTFFGKTKLLGVPIQIWVIDKLITCSAYILMGLISGIAGYLNMARLGSYYAAMGDGIEFMVIAAVVIGGTSMVGGSGSMIGTLVGTLLIGVINNALNLFSVAAEWQNVAKGFIIFLAVLFDAVKNRMKQAD